MSTATALKTRPLFAPTPDEPIVEHAVYYAEVNHWPVFPVRLGTKKSHKKAEYSGGRNWGHTTDADEIRADFKTWPDANVGIMTGAEAGIFVLETDTAAGHGDGVDGAAELAKLEALHGVLPPTLEAESPSGSIHRYFKHPGFRVSGSASKVAPGIDVRGDDGIVVAPPSVKPGVGVYRWRNGLEPAEAPQWLLDLISAAKKDEFAGLSISERAAAAIRPPAEYDPFEAYGRRTAFTGSDGYGPAYLDTAMSQETANVASAGKGGRNDQLNRSAFALGQLVTWGLSERDIIKALYSAAEACGHVKDKGPKQTMDTIKSGLMDGMKEPRPAPAPREEHPVVVGEPDQAAPPPMTPSEPTKGEPVQSEKPEGGQPVNNVKTLQPKPSPPKAMPAPLPMTLFDEVNDFVTKPWLIKGVVAKAETSLVVAPPKALKSALLADIAVCVASGSDWRGHKSKGAFGVVYFAFERVDLVKRRLAAHAQRDNLKGLPISIVGKIINLMHPACVDAFVSTILEAENKMGSKISMIIIDTLAKGMAAGGGDENQAKDMGAALAHLALVKERTGVHVAIVHHTGKDESKGARGSNSLLGDVDLQIQLSGEIIKTATVVHANDQAEGVLTRFKGETVVLGQDEDGDDITTMILSLDDCGGTGDGTKAKGNLSPTNKRAMDLLYNALNDHAKDPPHRNGFPFGAKVVPLDTWRDYCERGNLSDGKSSDAFRTAFKRATIALANAKRIGILDGYVWAAYD